MKIAMTASVFCALASVAIGFAAAPAAQNAPATAAAPATTTAPAAAAAPGRGGGRGRGAGGGAAQPLLPREHVAALPNKLDIEGNYEIGPDYKDPPEMTVKDGVARGKVTHFNMLSTESKVYPGLNGAYTRAVGVYVPAGYEEGTPLPFIVVQDGPSYESKGMYADLDNLIAQKRIPPMAAIMVNHGGGDGRGSERGLEYDTVSDRYSKFVETELLPRVSRECKVTFTKDPEGRATMGGSSGAAAAFTLAWFHPELYRRVLSYSGTFVNQQSPTDPALPHGAWELHEHLVPAADAKPIRIWMEVADRDNGSTSTEASLHNWVIANDHMAAALKAKGYHYLFVFANGAGHVDAKVVKQTLPGALEWLWKTYTPKG